MAFKYGMADFLDFKDREVCERVRRIKREEITNHRNPDFRIEVIQDEAQFYGAFATDIVGRIKQSLDEGRRFVAIFPVGPTAQYPIAARMINELRIPMHHVHTFNMDEYADEDGNTAPADWEGSFQKCMFDSFFNLIDRDLRPPPTQIHFPTTGVLGHYPEMIEAAGGVDMCYGGIGWCGHIAFWESSLGYEFGDDLDSYMKAGPRLVTLTPMTIMQNAMSSFGGDWSWVPPKANTIGPAQIMNARDRSFWLSYLTADVSWQRFIARLAAHGPISTFVPGTILQTVPTRYVLLGGVADNVLIRMT